MFRCGCCPLRRCGYVFRHRWRSMHPRHGCVPKPEQAHSCIPYRAAEHPRWPQDRAYGQLPLRGHDSRNTLSSGWCRLISNHYLRCRCGGQGLCRRFQTYPRLLRHRCWIVRRGDKQIQIKKGLPQSFKGYDSNGYSLFYAVTTV